MLILCFMKYLIDGRGFVYLVFFIVFCSSLIDSLSRQKREKEKEKKRAYSLPNSALGQNSG